MESPEKVEAPLELCGGRRKEARAIAWMRHKEEALDWNNPMVKMGQPQCVFFVGRAKCKGELETVVGGLFETFGEREGKDGRVSGT